MDASPRRYETFADLEPYCHRVASAVGLMCIRIFGYRDPAVRDYARDLGVALQLTNILRDVAVDFRSGRIYLPLEDLARFGCVDADIRQEVERAGRGVQNERLRAVLEHQAARARVYLLARHPRPPAGGDVQPHGGRDHARNLLGVAATHRARSLRRVQPHHPCAPADAGPHRDRHVVEDSAISRPPMTTDVVVIGAGFAGLSAAVRLAASGLTVAVVEEAPRLGGRATAFADRETGERVDNGQHVLFGCYRETYDFLRRIGTETLAPLQTRLSLTLAAPDGRSFDLTCPELPPPWHLLAAVLRWPAMPHRDRLSVLWLWSLLRQARREGAASAAAGVAVQQTVTDWLAAHRQSDELCRWLWRPLAIAALNQSPDVAAAAPFVRVLAELFGPRVEDSSVGLATVPLDELYAEPAQTFR